jgi:4'-phosphopantetheinyl transferase
LKAGKEFLSAELALTTSEVHLWQVNPADHQDMDLLASYERLLDSDELHRWRRFAIEAVRTRFLISHGILRSILSRYLPLAPESSICRTRAMQLR